MLRPSAAWHAVNVSLAAPGPAPVRGVGVARASASATNSFSSARLGSEKMAFMRERTCREQIAAAEQEGAGTGHAMGGQAELALRSGGDTCGEQRTDGCTLFL